LTRTTKQAKQVIFSTIPLLATMT